MSQQQNIESRESLKDSNDGMLTRGGHEVPLRPDRLFACSGRGVLGTITEYRYGFPARVGLDLECGTPIHQCWVLSSLDSNMPDSFWLLLAFPDSSLVLQIAEDLSAAPELPPDMNPLDMSSKTLSAAETDGLVIQVTTSSIVVVNNGHR